MPQNRKPKPPIAKKKPTIPPKPSIIPPTPPPKPTSLNLSSNYNNNNNNSNINNNLSAASISRSSISDSIVSTEEETFSSEGESSWSEAPPPLPPVDYHHQNAGRYDYVSNEDDLETPVADEPEKLLIGANHHECQESLFNYFFVRRNFVIINWA